jgi:dihydropyrimidinase
MYPRKGVVAVGSDADIVVWDPAGTRTFSAKTQFAKGGFNVFEGRTVTGIPSYTLSAGKVVFERGELRAVEGAGRHIDRPAFTPTHA